MKKFDIDSVHIEIRMFDYLHSKKQTAMAYTRAYKNVHHFLA